MTTEKTDNNGSQGAIPKSGSVSSRFVVFQQIIYITAIIVVAMLTALHASNMTGQVSGVEYESISALTFLAVFAAMTVFVLLIMKSQYGSKLLSAMFALAVITGMASLIGIFFGMGASILAFALGAFLYYSNPHVAVFNLLLILGLAGVSASVGFGFNPITLLAVMAVLALYDVIAVYVTRHMVKMARVMIKRKAFFAVILPSAPSGLFKRLNQVKPGSEFSFLGTGDLAFPALFAVAVTTSQGVLAALPVAIGSILGLLVTSALFWGQKIKQPMPALPPIVLGSIAGYAITLIINL